MATERTFGLLKLSLDGLVVGVGFSVSEVVGVVVGVFVGFDVGVEVGEGVEVISSVGVGVGGA